MISNGYGKLKQKTFRIAYMAELTLADMKELLSNIDELIKKFNEKTGLLKQYITLVMTGRCSEKNFGFEPWRFYDTRWWVGGGLWSGKVCITQIK